MIYDNFGKPIEETPVNARIPVGMNVFPEASDRYTSDASRALTPSKVDMILTAANQGETSEQCKLSLELEEKNHDVAHCMETRKNAALGVPWTIEPGDDTPAAKKAAEDLKKALDVAGNGNKLDTFRDLCSDMLTAIIPGFAVSEIIWKPGGEIAGFKYIDQRHFTFRSGSMRLMTTGEPDGVELPPRKFIVNQYRRRGSNIARGGLIRPLAWLHCFQNLNFKDLLRFIERYGMPFTVAKVDKDSWDNERNALKALIRNFGPDGGGVFTRAVEVELLQASGNTGDVYFKLLEYVGAAIAKIILGQTASSGDSSGLSKGDSQSKVRQDILEADCATLAATLNSQLSTPWSVFNCPTGTASPRVVFHPEPNEDKKAAAETVKILYESGLEADETEMSEKFGMKLTRRAVAAPVVNGGASLPSPIADSTAFSAEGRASLAESAAPSDTIASNALAKFAGDAGKWAGDFAKTVANLAEKGTPEEIAALSADKKLPGLFNTQALASAIENTVFASAAAGAAGRMEELKIRSGKKNRK